MIKKNFLNGSIYHIKVSDLPCLVTYPEKVGGSYFSLTVIADLFKGGAKVLFLTAYPMAKDNFLQQIVGMENELSYVDDIKNLNPHSRGIIIESGNEKLFLEVVKVLEDIDERIVFVKNMEVFSEETVRVCLPLQMLIFSGDLDKCSLKESILQKVFVTKVAFNKQVNSVGVMPSDREKYTAHLWSKGVEGIMTFDW